MAKQTIAVDIDDVLSLNVPAFLAYSNKKWGTQLTIDDFTEDWAVMWKVDRDTEIKRAQEVEDDKIFSTHEHFEDALPVLAKLAKDYHLVVATARKKTLVDDTLEWINNYFPDIFSEVHHADIWNDEASRHQAHMKTKADLMKQIEADYLIDDQPKHCIAAAAAGIETLLFGEYPWNSQTPHTKGVTRVHNWDEVERYFDGR